MPATARTSAELSLQWFTSGVLRFVRRDLVGVLSFSTSCLVSCRDVLSVVLMEH